MSAVLKSLCLVALLSVAVMASAADVTATVRGKTGPSLNVTYAPEARFENSKLAVEAADSSGLAEIEILDRANDVRYQTQVSRPDPGVTFARSFSLSEIYPSGPPHSAAVRLEVKVKNTKGQTASVTAAIRLEK